MDKTETPSPPTSRASEVTAALRVWRRWHKAALAGARTWAERERLDDLEHRVVSGDVVAVVVELSGSPD